MAGRIPRLAAYGAAATALAAVLAACGGGSSGGSQAVSPATGGGAATGSSASLTTHSTSLGTVSADAQGMTVYELNGNPASNTMCTSGNGCQAIWTPVMS